MKLKLFAATALLCLGSLLSAGAQERVEQWGRFEAAFTGTPTGNPFNDVDLKAIFTNGNETVKVTGFYDGNGIYKIRFMPCEQGTWT